MSEKEIQKKIVEQSGTIAKAICKGKDVELRKSASGVFCYISNTIHIATRINDF